MSLMGIDIGTTGCKAAVFNLGGKCLAHAYREYHILHKHPGWSELDSADVLAKVRQVVAETVLAARPKDPVTALSISSMGEAMTPVSRRGAILGTSILSSDTRGGDLLKKALKGIDQSAFYRINPNIISASYSLPKLLWIRKNDPALYKKTDYFLLWADLAAFMLGCAPVTSYSLANRTLLFDIRRRDWSDKLLDLSGIGREKLPVTRSSGTIVGAVSTKAARELGLNKNVKVVLGGHDQCCNALGAGAVDEGSAVCGIGSYECITPVYASIPDPGAMLKCGLNIEHHLLENRYVSFIFNQAGLLVKWFRDNFASAELKESNIYDKLTAEMPAGPTRLLVLPYFDISGAPDYIADASGVVAGLKTSTRRGEILKAIMEGETYYFIKSIGDLKKIGIKITHMTATGGGARSGKWLQLKADILGIPIVRPVTTETGLGGAAMLAGLATGAYKRVAEATGRFVRPDRVFEPDQQKNRIYRERYGMYLELFKTMRPFLAEWSQVTDG